MRTRTMTLILILTQEARMRILVLSNLRLCQDLVMSSLFYEHIYTDVFFFSFVFPVCYITCTRNFFPRICIWFRKAITLTNLQRSFNYLFLWCVKLELDLCFVQIFWVDFNCCQLFLASYNKLNYFCYRSSERKVVGASYSELREALCVLQREWNLKRVLLCHYLLLWCLWGIHF